VTINGLSYLVTKQLAAYYQTAKSADLSALDVEFSFCFYLIMSAGVACVFSVAFSLLCRRTCHASRGCCPDSVRDQAGSHRRRYERLTDADFSQMCAAAGMGAPVSVLPPPPYAP